MIPVISQTDQHHQTKNSHVGLDVEKVISVYQSAIVLHPVTTVQKNQRCVINIMKYVHKSVMNASWNQIEQHLDDHEIRNE